MAGEACNGQWQCPRCTSGVRPWDVDFDPRTLETTARGFRCARCGRVEWDGKTYRFGGTR